MHFQYYTDDGSCIVIEMSADQKFFLTGETKSLLICLPQPHKTLHILNILLSSTHQLCWMMMELTPLGKY